MLHIVSPYVDGPCYWFRGNLHTHTTRSDGPYSPQETIRQYAALGYDFLMLSDHDTLADLNGLDPAGLVLLTGNEITTDGPHMLHVGATRLVAPMLERQDVLDAIAASGGFAVMSHPNWERECNHCPQETLMRLHGYAGIEIYNGVVAWLEGNPDATDRWDRLLPAGKRVWGFANDDCHVKTDLGTAWNVAQLPVEKPDAAAILHALRNGAFYASTGIVIESIEVRGNAVTVRTANADRVTVYSDYGYRRAFADDAEITFSPPPDADYTYFRFECSGPHEQRAWTQPFFVTR